jgi:hypothetical protein
MDREKRQDGSALDNVAESRRSALRKIAAATAFVTPMVASFSTDGLRFNTAEAGIGSNQSNGGLIAKIIHFFLDLFGRRT